MDFQPRQLKQFESRLVVAQKSNFRIKTVGGPGLVWLLIVFMLFFMGFAIKSFDRDKLSANPSPNFTNDPLPTEIKQARVYTVIYKNGVFSPTNLRIHAGDTVRFKNEGFLAIKIASGPENDNIVGFDSIGDIPQGSLFSFTFAAKGIFGYHNVKNPEEQGTVIVR